MPPPHTPRWIPVLRMNARALGEESSFFFFPSISLDLALSPWFWSEGCNCPSKISAFPTTSRNDDEKSESRDGITFYSSEKRYLMINRPSILERMNNDECFLTWFLFALSAQFILCYPEIRLITEFSLWLYFFCKKHVCKTLVTLKSCITSFLPISIVLETLKVISHTLNCNFLLSLSSAS